MASYLTLEKRREEKKRKLNKKENRIERNTDVMHCWLALSGNEKELKTIF